MKKEEPGFPKFKERGVDGPKMYFVRTGQRKLSRKKSKKGVATSRNYLKQLKTVQKAHQRLANIRADYQNKVVFDLVKTKPSHIAIENLNIRSMMKNRHLSKAIAQQGFNL